jgi:hypothetical protein
MTDQAFGPVDEILPASRCNSEPNQLGIKANLADSDLGLEAMLHLGAGAVLVYADDIADLIEALHQDGDVRVDVPAADVDQLDRRQSAVLVLVANRYTVPGWVQVNLVLTAASRHVYGEVARGDLLAVFERVVEHVENYGAETVD